MPFFNFKKWIYSCAKPLPLSLLLPALPGSSVVPLYHTVSDYELPHIKNLYKTKTSREFSQEIDFLSQHFEFVDLESFCKRNQENTSGKRFSLLTFDDGLKEFYDLVAPMLQKKGIPAVCFLNSDFIDNKGLMYRYKASLLIEYLQTANAKKQTLAAQILNCSNGMKQLKNAILNLGYQENEKRQKLAKLVDLNFQQFLENEKPYLSSEQIASLAKQDFAFGAHSASHPLYAKLSIEKQLTESQVSLNRLNELFQQSINSFAFPFTDDGVSTAFFNQFQKQNKEVITFGTAGLKLESQQNHYQRIPFEYGNFSAKEIMKGELLSFQVKKVIGKHKMKR